MNVRKEKMVMRAKRGMKAKPVFGWKKALALFFCIISSVAGVGMVMFYNTVSSINYEYIADDNTTASDLTASGSMNTDLNSDELLNDPQILNIMLFGEDNNNGDEHGRSDTMIMLSIDYRHKKL